LTSIIPILCMFLSLSGRYVRPSVHKLPLEFTDKHDLQSCRQKGGIQNTMRSIRTDNYDPVEPSTHRPTILLLPPHPILSASSKAVPKAQQRL